MSGDALSGWKVASNNDLNSVLEAAKDNPYRFFLKSNGAYQTEIEELPGNVEEYQSFLKHSDKEDLAKYYVAYYYSTANNLDEVTSENTYQILNQIEEDDEYKDFTREFASKLYVPNIKNTLLVHKVDERMEGLDGATFALYKENDIIVNQDGTYTIKDNVTSYDEATTRNLNNMKAGIVFPSQDKVLDMGVYYLVETKAPEGYKPNPKAIKVIVDDTGVYADAGDKDDNVKVARSVGMIVRSMLQFAAKDKVDATLHDIKAQLLTASNYNHKETNWSKWNNNPASKDEMHLQYEEDNPILDYGFIESEKLEHDYPALLTDVGFSKLEIRQCLKHDDESSEGLKQDLNETDLTNLFSGLTTVIVGNESINGTGSLKVSKTVNGNKGDTNKLFNFTLKIDKDINGKYGEMNFTNGEATFTLKHGESKTANWLPVGVKYVVSELEANKDGYITTQSNASGMITKSESHAHFVNTKNEIKPTPEPTPESTPKPTPEPTPGQNPNLEKPNHPNEPKDNVPNTSDETNLDLWLTLLGLSFAGLIIILLINKSKHKEE